MRATGSLRGRRSAASRWSPAPSRTFARSRFPGLSLPVLIELLLSRDQASDADEIRGLIEAAHAQTLAEIKVEMAQGSSDEDDLDL